MYESMRSIGIDVLKLCKFHFFSLVLMIVSPLQMVKLIVPLADHFPGRVTYRGKKHLEGIKKKFIKFGLFDRVKESPFKQFFFFFLHQSSISLGFWCTSLC